MPQGKLQAELSGPAGDFALDSAFKGDNEQALLEPLLQLAALPEVYRK